ncbi:hypothetical protein HanRHA438_Chr09g0397221 [Helianthus annuus]|nr:hypothetical protein HanHA89_Chr09g0337481 [Helianthus annuus]KAJ0888006.1 hypothetical protein HanRHA438_Chr09g0397221 [Helianthus annuus]
MPSPSLPTLVFRLLLPLSSSPCRGSPLFLGGFIAGLAYSYPIQISFWSVSGE